MAEAELDFDIRVTNPETKTNGFKSFEQFLIEVIISPYACRLYQSVHEMFEELDLPPKFTKALKERQEL